MTNYTISNSNRIMNGSNNQKQRNRELSEFLRARRESLNPEDMGFPKTNRRRTRGLRREEVATLAGVGLSWYTWLEQGRDITVSSSFLDRLAKVLCLSPLERDHLFILAQNRPPAEDGETGINLPQTIQDLMDDLTMSPCYAWNLKWDIIGWNRAADAVFKFHSYDKNSLNFIWLLFTEPHIRNLIINWEKQANDILSSFRRDYAKDKNDADANILINSLKNKSPDFASLWERQEAHAKCEGVRDMKIDTIGEVSFEHATLIIDEKRHLKLTYYKAMSNVELFGRWVTAQSQNIDNNA